MQALRFNENIRLTIEELHVSIFVIKLDSDYAFFILFVCFCPYRPRSHRSKKTLAG